jgi:hypothetical protein
MVSLIEGNALAQQPGDTRSDLEQLGVGIGETHSGNRLNRPFQRAFEQSRRAQEVIKGTVFKISDG